MKYLNTIPLTCLFIIATFSVTDDIYGQKQNQLHVCAINASDQSGVPNARIRLSSEAGIFTKTTDFDGCVHFFDAIRVGVDQVSGGNSDVSVAAVYPNPTNGTLRIRVRSQGQEPCELSVFDMAGRAVAVSQRWYRIQDGFEIEADVRDLSDGVYAYRVTNALTRAHGTFVKSRNGFSGATSPGLLATDLFTASETIASSSDNASVRIEISHEEFGEIVEERVVNRGEIVAIPLFKSTNDRVPLIDLLDSMYLGEYEGGLYPEARNEMPATHLEEGIRRANQIQPLDTQGRPDPAGKIIMTSVGMSTTSSIFCGVADPADSCKQGTFMNVVQFDPEINNDQLVFIDGAEPGKVTDQWLTPGEKTFDRIQTEELTPLGLSELQVQVAWVNLASTQPTVSLPEPDADAFLLKQQYGDVMRALHVRYPNLKMVLFSSRIYGGYATSTINPEPYAYESGFAVKWLIEAQLNQMYLSEAPVDQDSGDLNYETSAPWLAWGPYMWADGLTPRSDGLMWAQQDLKADGTHLARLGIEKYAAIFIDFLKTSPFTRCWAVRGGVCQ